jgi:hypothetical protein
VIVVCVPSMGILFNYMVNISNVIYTNMSVRVKGISNLLYFMHCLCVNQKHNVLAVTREALKAHSHRVSAMMK